MPTTLTLRAQLATLNGPHNARVDLAVAKLTAARDKANAAQAALDTANNRLTDAQSGLDLLHEQHRTRTTEIYAEIGRNAEHGEPSQDETSESPAPTEESPKRGPGRPRRNAGDVVVTSHTRARPGTAGGADTGADQALLLLVPAHEEGQ